MKNEFWRFTDFWRTTAVCKLRNKVLRILLLTIYQKIWLISKFEQEYDKLLESIELMSFTPLYNIVLFKDAYYCMIYFYTFLSEFSNLAPCLKVSLLRSLFLCRKINLTKLTSGFGVIINFSLLCVCSYQFLPLFSSIYTKNSCRFLSCWRMGTKK